MCNQRFGPKRVPRAWKGLRERVVPQPQPPASAARSARAETVRSELASMRARLAELERELEAAEDP